MATRVATARTGHGCSAEFGGAEFVGLGQWWEDILADGGAQGAEEEFFADQRDASADDDDLRGGKRDRLRDGPAERAAGALERFSSAVLPWL